MENWKPIPNFPGYKASTEGQILNVKTQRILSNAVTEKGNAVVSLKCDGKYRTVKVHRIIAKTFLDEQLNLDICHKDQNRLNNRVDNLEWCTRKETVARRRRRNHED